MKRCFVLIATLALVTLSFSQSKPVVLISGNGNISIRSAGQAVGGFDEGYGWAASTHQATVSKHDQTMEMAQDFLQFCPAVETTLSVDPPPDYFVVLNREGQPFYGFELGQSQAMVLNRHKAVIYVVSKKAKVKTAVQDACNAIAADWQAHGRLAVAVVPTVTPATSTNIPVTSTVASVPPPVKQNMLALVINTTAGADKYCSPKTITQVSADIRAYLLSKGIVLGTVEKSRHMLVVIINRPITKWLEITIQERDGSGAVLWNEKVSQSSAGASFNINGTKGMLIALEKAHQVIDAHLTASAEQDTLPQKAVVQATAINDMPGTRPSEATAAALAPILPASDPPLQQATIEFWSRPGGASIELDGKYVGITPSEIAVPLGRHTITMRKQGCRTWEKTINVASASLTVPAYLEQTSVRLDSFSK